MLSVLIFYTLLFLSLVAVPAALILLVLLFLEHESRLWQRVAPIIRPIGVWAAQQPVFLDLRKRFPRFERFLERRLDPHDAWGLAATVAGIGILLGVWLFLGVLQDIVARDPLVILNIRLHNTVPLFRSAGMTWFMLALTQLGSGIVLSLVCLSMALLALARQQPRAAVAWLLALAGTALLSSILKALVDYARPIDAIIRVHEASFPSGHMLSGTVVYGLLAALLISSPVRRGLRALGITLLILVIVGIGLSRLYLGVHWPSDLLGSLALALMVLASLLFFLHYDHPIDWIDTFKPPIGARVLRIAGRSVLLLALGAAAVLTIQTELVSVRMPPAAHSITLQALQASLPADLPLGSEDLIGGRMEPISIVFVGAEKDLVESFGRAGWRLADLPTPVRIVREGLAALRNRPDPTGPATPAYFADRPQNLTFEKPDAGSSSIRRRHHTRLWKTAYCLAPNCRPVWVGTASFDTGMELSKRLHLPTHRIDPAIDNERAMIVSDLVGVGVTQEGSVAVSRPLHGFNAAGDPFSTDGRAIVLVLP